ncbi:MAG: insulinase family protein [Bacilli bacterium]|nr:insulinase family protein [Bacilli bacterium]
MNKLETVVLENGLTIYLYKEPRRHSTFFQFNTYCGGLTKHFTYHGKEYHLPDGVAHILEHYLVECNDRGNFLDELGKKQMSTNASTSPEITNYYFETVEKVCEGIQIVLDGIYHVSFTKEKLEKLKNPIYQEIRGKQDNKFYHLNRHRMSTLFSSIDFQDVGGTIQEVESTTTKDLKTLYQAFYHPKNQFIVIAGNFDKKEVLETIKSFYKELVFDSYDTKLIPFQESIDVHKKEESFTFPSPLPFTEVCFKISREGYTNTELLDLDFYIHTFFSSTFGVTSPLHKELVDDHTIIDSIRFSMLPMDSYYVLSFGAYTENPEKLQKKILEEIQNLNHLDVEKFEMDKKNSIVQMILRDENIFSTILPFINNIIYYDYPYLDQVEDVENLNYDQYSKMIHNLDFSHYSILTIYPQKKAD